jgi:hypothetical protein
MTESGRARHLKQLAWVMLAISVLAPALSHSMVEHTENTWFATVIAAVGLALVSFYLLYRSRQYAALARERAATPDARAPVLYLRSFSRDMTALKAAFLLQHNVSGSLEEQLRDAVAPIGPLISIAIPGEQLPSVGAHRIHMADNEWQAKVDTLMQSAALVIILVGKGGAGLGWEIQRAFDTVDRNLLLLFVTRGKRQYEQSVEGIERASGVKLPTYRSINRMVGPPRFMGANCFLSFPREGGVVVLKLRAPFLRGFGVFTAEARYALKPFFEMHGFSWMPPPISISNVIVVLAVVAFVFVLIFV